MICPSCTGSGAGGRVLARISTPTGDRCEWQESNCSTCCGTGSVSDDHAEMVAAGQAFRDARQALDLSLREAAKVLGVSPADVSGWEWGRKRIPADAVERMRASYAPLPAALPGGEG